MNQIEKLNLLYGNAKPTTRTAIKKAVQKFGLEFTDETTGEYLDRNEFFTHLEEQKFLKNKNMKKTTTAAKTATRKEITVANIPFFTFDQEGEKFLGAILRKHSLNFSGEEKQTFVCADELGDEVIMPTNVQLQMLLTTAANTNDLPCKIEIEFTGYKATAKGRAKQFKLFTV